MTPSVSQKRKASTLEGDVKQQSKKQNIEIKKEVKKEEVKKEEDLSDDYSDTEEYDFSQHNVLSEYERQREENMKRNKEIMDQLNIKQAKDEVSPVSNKKLLGLGLKKKKKEATPAIQLPRRVSMRLKRIDPDGNALPELPPPSPPTDMHPQKPAGPLDMKSINDVEEATCSECLKEWSRLSSGIKTNWHSQKKVANKATPTDLKSYMKTIESLEVKDHHVAKLTPDRILSLQIHPMEEKTLVLAGDKWGKIGVWDVDSDKGDNGVILFEPHSRPINCMKVVPWDSSKVYSCSYDATVRCGNMSTETFVDVYRCEEDEDEYYNSFCWPALSSGNMYLACSTGQIRQIDTRTGKCENAYNAYQRSLRWVDSHPLNEHLLLSACSNGAVTLWDVRQMKTKGQSSHISSMDATRSVSSVFFSPQTGNKVLTTSYDDYLRVFNLDESGKVESSAMTRHDNHTGRWLTTFRACWDPKTDDVFLCGSMKRPRQVDLYCHQDGKTKLLDNMMHENFTTVCSVNAFHPSKHIIAGGNSSGRVTVWTEK